MKNFAETLKAVRKSNHLSQKAVCQDICSIREYMRIENDQHEPSNYFLRKISQRLGYDFEAYYFSLMANGEDASFFEHRKELMQLCKSKEYLLLREKIEFLYSLPLYSLLENKKMLMYYEAIYYSEYEKDYDKSNQLCMKIIKDDDPHATIDSFCSKIYSKYAIFSAHNIALNYSAQDDKTKMIQIYKALIDRINELDRDDISFYQSNLYRRNLHQTLLYNLSINYFKVNNLIESERCIDDAIKYAADYSSLFLLAELCGQKAQILCDVGNFAEAKKYLELSTGLYLLQGQDKKEQMVQDNFHKLYPDMF